MVFKLAKGSHEFRNLNNIAAFILPFCCRIEDDTESETSDDLDSSADVPSPLSTLREQLLCDLEVVFSPLPLRMICRNVIRTSILSQNSFAQIKSLIQTLPVPNDTKNYLSFVNVPHTHLIRWVLSLFSVFSEVLVVLKILYVSGFLCDIFPHFFQFDQMFCYSRDL